MCKMFGRQRKTISEELVVSHCSPTMAGLKTGSLFSCMAEDSDILAKDIRSLSKSCVGKLGGKKIDFPLCVLFFIRQF